MSFPATRVLLFFALLALAVILPMRWVDSHLKTQESCCCFLGRELCSPVLCFEFAWTTEKADSTLASWNGRLHYLTFGFGLDFLFLLVYPVVFFLGLQQIAKHAAGYFFKRMAASFAPVVLASGIFDAIENICLLRYIFGNHEMWLLKTAGVCAGIKFALLIVGGLIILVGLLIMLFEWLKNRIRN